MFWPLFPRKRPTISKTALDLFLLFGLLVLFYGRSLLTPIRMSYGGDAMSLFLPALEHYRQALFNGALPLWNSSTWLGAPFMAAFQGAALYPPQLLTLFFKTPAAAQNFMTFLSLLWLSYGAYVFGLRALELERFASLLMAIVMGCSGFVGGHSDHLNQLAAISWIPWIMAEAILLLRRPRMKNALLLALFLAMQVLAGHPQYVAYSLLYLLGLVACYSVYYYHRRKAHDPPAWFGIFLIAAASATGMGLASAQILPAAELSKRSVRPLDPPDRALTCSFPPKHLMTLVASNAYGNPREGLHEAFDKENKYAYNHSEFVCYFGLITLALALLAVITLIREFIVRAFAILALLSLLIAFGVHLADGAFYLFLMKGLPGGEGFRVPARFLIFFILSLSVLAAVGFNQATYYLANHRRISSRAIRALSLFILTLVYFDLYLFSQSQGFWERDSVDILEKKGPILSHLIANSGEHRIFRLMPEVPLNLGEGEAQSYYKYRDLAGSAVLEDRRQIRRIGPRLQIERLQYNQHLLWGLQACQGYEEGLLPPLAYRTFMGYDTHRHRMGRYTRSLNNPIPDSILLGLLNVRYILVDNNIPVNAPHLKLVPNLPERVLTGYTENKFAKIAGGSRFQEFSLYENLDYLPRFNWGEKLRPLVNFKTLDISAEEHNLITMDVKNPDRTYLQVALGETLTTSSAVLSSSTLLSLVGRDQGLNGKRIKGSPNAYIVTKNPIDQGEILLLEAPYPGWVARWEGQNEPVVMRRANSIMMSVDVPVGPDKIHLSYEPYSFRLGLFISCCFITFLSSLLFFLRLPADSKPRKRISLP